MPVPCNSSYVTTGYHRQQIPDASSTSILQNKLLSEVMESSSSVILCVCVLADSQFA